MVQMKARTWKVADAVVILTEWNEFRALDLPRLARTMRTPAMADLRNIYTQHDAGAAGFTAYVAVGRLPLSAGKTPQVALGS